MKVSRKRENVGDAERQKQKKDVWMVRGGGEEEERMKETWLDGEKGEVLEAGG